MHNLSTVVRFEIIRTLKKKSFWITILGFPVIIGVIIAVVYFSNKTTDEVTKDLQNEKFSVGINDISGKLSSELVNVIGAESIPNKGDGINKVKSGTLDAFFYYPADVSENSVEVYGKNVGLFKNSRYQSVAEELLKQSVATTTPADARAVLQDTVTYASTTYTADGAIDKGFLNVIAPGIFLVLFYLLIAMFGNQVLTSTTEEKENRVTEMILTTVQPTILLFGKLISIIVLAVIQVIAVLIPVLVAYFSLREQLTLPSFDISTIPFDAFRVSVGAALFIIGFIMFAGLLMAIGAATPTAKEASGFFGLIMLLIFGPLYAASLFVSAPGSTIVQVLSFFPLTAPIPLLLRNAVGNLSFIEAIVGISLMAITTIVILALAVRIFRYGALEYSRRLSLKEIFGSLRA